MSSVFKKFGSLKKGENKGKVKKGKKGKKDDNSGPTEVIPTSPPEQPQQPQQLQQPPVEVNELPNPSLSVPQEGGGVPPGGNPAAPGEEIIEEGLPARALYEYEPEQEDEIPLAEGDFVIVYERDESGWWTGECRGKYGLFPGAFVELIDPREAAQRSTPENVAPPTETFVDGTQNVDELKAPEGHEAEPSPGIAEVTEGSIQENVEVEHTTHHDEHEHIPDQIDETQQPVDLYMEQPVDGVAYQETNVDELNNQIIDLSARLEESERLRSELESKYKLQEEMLSNVTSEKASLAQTLSALEATRSAELNRVQELSAEVERLNLQLQESTHNRQEEDIATSTLQALFEAEKRRTSELQIKLYEQERKQSEMAEKMAQAFAARDQLTQTIEQLEATVEQQRQELKKQENIRIDAEKRWKLQAAAYENSIEAERKKQQQLVDDLQKRQNIELRKVEEMLKQQLQNVKTEVNQTINNLQNKISSQSRTPAANKPMGKDLRS
jgi:hypothetical protein